MRGRVAHIDAALDVEVQTLCHIVKGDCFLFESFGKSVITGNETGNQRSERADDAVDGMVAFGEKHVKTDAQVESKEGILFERRKVKASAAVDFGRTFGSFCFGEVLFDVNYGSAVGIEMVVYDARLAVDEIVPEICADLFGQSLPLPGLALLTHVTGHVCRTSELLIP